MESKEKIINYALDQLIMRALYDLEQSDDAVKEAGIRLSSLYDSLKFDNKLDDAVQALISQYIEQTIIATNTELRHIYLQGAKDVIIAMRSLGAIK